VRTIIFEETRRYRTEFVGHTEVFRLDRDWGRTDSDSCPISGPSRTPGLRSGLLDLEVGEGLRLDRELIGKAAAPDLPSFVVRGPELGGCRKGCRLRVDSVGVPCSAASAALRICDPSVPASPTDRYSKGVAETENKAKKKLVSITTETSM
jgi:hypothetical protein